MDLKNILSKLMKKAVQGKQPGSTKPNTKHPLAPNLDENAAILSTLFANCADIVIRRFQIHGQTKALLIYIEGMSDKELIDRDVLAPLMSKKTAFEETCSPLLEQIPVSSAIAVTTLEETIEQIMAGNPVMVVDQKTQAFSIQLVKFEKRGIEDPTAESVVRGPRQGFTETLQVNTTLIRRIIKNPHLKMKSVTLGGYTQTKVIITYIDGIATDSLIAEIESRLQRIEIDGILESAYIEELIQDNPASPFPQLLATERPDVVCANLLEGRAAILVDGTPFALVAPITFFSMLQSPEDYYERFWAGTVIRWLRFFFFIIALIVPSTYVAILTYHQEMIPTTLMLSVAKSREEIPFPALVEALLMEVTFEALREAGVRLPKQVGAAVSIVGALVIGQAAISAGLVSSPMVMVVAITGIASFTIPRYNMGVAVRILRFPLMFLAGMLGLLGLMLGLITIFVHLSALRSFGVPYLAPVAPLNKSLVKDVLTRAPLWIRNKRPHLTGGYNLLRQDPGLKPGPPQGDE